MLKLYIRDNTSGQVHEYGTNEHDALILQADGSLHYENLQCCCGTMFPDEGYSFCFADGKTPNEVEDRDYRDEPYIDIGGEYYRDKRCKKEHKKREKMLKKLAKKLLKESEED